MANLSHNDINGLFERQLRDWATARDNFAALKNVKVKELKVGNATFKLQFNPARIISSAAKVDAKSLKARKCFLCAENRPPQQEGLNAERDYTVLINPFPIFPRHLTIPCNRHIDQRIKGRIGDMMTLAASLQDFILFYNGPKCGASAPDHMHFQAGNKGFMTYDSDLKHATKEIVATQGASRLSYVAGLSRVSFLIESADLREAEFLFGRLYEALPLQEGEDEPMLNILCWAEAEKWYIAVFPRVKHRPACYFAEGDDNILITPASVDMGGVFIAPLEKDFNKVTAADVKTILDEVCFTEAQAREVINAIKE